MSRVYTSKEYDAKILIVEKIYWSKLFTKYQFILLYRNLYIAQFLVLKDNNIKSYEKQNRYQMRVAASL